VAVLRSVLSDAACFWDGGTKNHGCLGCLAAWLPGWLPGCLGGRAHPICGRPRAIVLALPDVAGPLRKLLARADPRPPRSPKVARLSRMRPLQNACRSPCKTREPPEIPLGYPAMFFLRKVPYAKDIHILPASMPGRGKDASRGGAQALSASAGLDRPLPNDPFQALSRSRNSQIEYVRNVRYLQTYDMHLLISTMVDRFEL